MTVEYLYEIIDDDYTTSDLEGGSIRLELIVNYKTFTIDELSDNEKNLKIELKKKKYELHLMKTFKTKEVENLEDIKKFLQNKIDNLEDEKKEIKKEYIKKSQLGLLKKLEREIQLIKDGDFSRISNEEIHFIKQYEQSLENLRFDFINFKIILQKEKVHSISKISEEIQYIEDNTLFEYDDIQNEWKKYEKDRQNKKRVLIKKLVDRRLPDLQNLKKIEEKLALVIENENNEPSIKKINKLIFQFKNKVDMGKKEQEKFLKKQKEIFDDEKNITIKKIERRIDEIENEIQDIEKEKLKNIHNQMEYKTINNMLLNNGTKAFEIVNTTHSKNKKFSAHIFSKFKSREGKVKLYNEWFYDPVELLKSHRVTNIKNLDLTTYNQEVKSLKHNTIRRSKSKREINKKVLERVKKSPIAKVTNMISEIFLGKLKPEEKKISKGQKIINDIKNQVKKTFSSMFIFNKDKIDKELQNEINKIKKENKDK